MVWYVCGVVCVWCEVCECVNVFPQCYILKLLESHTLKALMFMHQDHHRNDHLFMGYIYDVMQCHPMMSYSMMSYSMMSSHDVIFHDVIFHDVISGESIRYTICR